ncbi:Alcohol dehydrogenase, class IV [Desulforamulus putei DSM 12395]|uniref:Alcohol dehydrogenase, class IV n=1 Tax=Desulforamulus putei DSM 12395 TaxID=1121429 RepID=A0A1M5CBM8_9FIRM|nr:1-propanol dehydrogenase PduQ [Desulforamulus putei]SHF52138.1 Alcohol dehydrogenase, class IV [Desulforamulus putei DSM 12395]
MNRFSVKPAVYFNRGAVEFLSTLSKSRAFVITDPFMVKVGYADQIIAILKARQIECAVFSDIKPDPPIDIVAAGMKSMLQFNPDVLIALGGGSTIDAAKSILAFGTNIMKNNAPNYTKPLFIAVPTTSGTGSEVTSFAVITRDEKKIPLVDDSLIPDIAIIDADFVKTVPPQITADTAIDALTHAIEAYVSTDASDFSDALAEKAVKIIFDYLLNAYHDGNDLEAREKLHNASCLAGMAFTNASLGINHSMAHALGGMFHIPHGRANAILLPYVIRYNSQLESGKETRAAVRYAELTKLIGLPAASVTEGVNNLVCAINILLRETKTPANLNEAGVEESAFLDKVNDLAETALADKCTVTNPRTPCKEEIVQLYQFAYGE